MQGPPASLVALPLLPAGDFEGEVRVWHLPSGTYLATFAYGGAQFERAVRKLCWLAASSGDTTAHWPMLAAFGEDGGMQVWAVELPAGVLDGSSAASPPSSPVASAEQGKAAPAPPPVPCRLLARIAVAHRPQDCVSAACVEQAADGSLRIWTGDSSGHVALWDLSGLAAAAAVQSSSSTARLDAAPAAPAVPAVPRRLAHWRAAEAPIVSLDPLAPGKGLLLVGAQDASVSVWTQAGGLVGVFGKHTWDLVVPGTWQDPQALAPPPPLPLDSGGSGLTPRELIASTPRRSSWVVRSGSVMGSGAASALHLGGGSGSGSAAGSALPSARSLRGKDCAAAAAAAHTHGHGTGPNDGWTEQEPGSASRLPPLEGLAEALRSLAQLRLPIAEETGEGCCGQEGADMSPASSSGAVSVPSQQGGAAPPAAVGQAGTGTAFNPAGARLAALAAEAAARKADRWAIPVHVQAHSALALQRMEAVPEEAGGLMGEGWNVGVRR